MPVTGTNERYMRVDLILRKAITKALDQVAYERNGEEIQASRPLHNKYQNYFDTQVNSASVQLSSLVEQQSKN